MRVITDFCRLAMLILVTLPAAAQNVTIFNNFLPGRTYNCCGGWWVVGSAAGSAAGLVGAGLAAGAFTPTGNFNLSQIDIGFWFENGYSNAVTVSLNQDSGGIPGPVLETWTGIVGATPHGGITSIVTTLHPTLTIPLLAGKQYWLVAYPAASNTLGFFNVNDDLGKGPGGRVAYNWAGLGWNVVDTPNDGPAFDVLGTPNSHLFSDALRIPQIVDGGGWKTRFAITNTDVVPLSFNFQFWGEDGTPLLFPILNGTPGVLSGTLAPGASYFADSPGMGSALQQGWAEIASSGRIGVRAIYQFSVGGSRDSFGTEVAVPSVNSVSVPFDNTQGNVTAIAVANTNPLQPLTVTMLFVTDGGAQSTVSLVLQPHARQAFVAPMINPAIADLRGSVKFTAPSADMAVMGLQFTAAGQFTSAGSFQ